MSFFLGFGGQIPLSPFCSQCSGTAKLPLRNSPLCRNLRRTSGVTWRQSSKLSTRFTSEQATYRLLRLFYKKSERAHFAAPPFQIASAYAGLRFGFGCNPERRSQNCLHFPKRKTRLGVSFFLDSAAHRAAPPFRLKCSGTAKPPLRNSPLRSEFTPHLRRGPEGPCYGVGCELGLSGDLRDVIITVYPFQKEGHDVSRVLLFAF